MAKRKVKIAGKEAELDLNGYQQVRVRLSGGNVKLIPLKTEHLRIYNDTLVGMVVEGEEQKIAGYKLDGGAEQIELTGGVTLTLIPATMAPAPTTKKQIISFDKEPLERDIANFRSIIALKEDDETYIDSLRGLDKEGYRDILSQLKSVELPEAQIMLAEVFNDLATLQIKLGHFSKDVSYYNNAAIRATYALSIAEKLEDPAKGKTIAQKATEQLKLAQKLLLETIGVSPAIINAERARSPEELANKKQLEGLREYTSKVIKGGQANFRPVFEKIATWMRSYLHNLLLDAEKAIGKPPCKYAVIGLGSMALKQLTPYSDLEFAILTAEDLPPDSPEKTYFRKLSHYVNFKVICLGETNIPFSDYRLNLDNLIKVAVNFDLGGKTPLGRSDKPYDLIQSVGKMLEYVRNDGNKYENIDKNLPYILETVCYVHGSKELVEHYQEGVREFLRQDAGDGRTYAEARAVKILAHGMEEMDALELGKIKPKKGDLDVHSFQAYETAGKLFNVKQEIYRIPDRFIYSLGMICGVHPTMDSTSGVGAWEVIDTLEQRKIINPDAAIKLRACVSFATSLRLKTYQHYGRQKDTMDFWPKLQKSVDDTTEIARQMFGLAKEDLSEGGALFKFYYTAFPLTRMLEQYCGMSKSSKYLDKQGFFVKETFYDNSLRTKAQVNLRLLKYQEFLDNNLERQKKLEGAGQQQSKEYAYVLNSVGVTCGNLGDHTKALKYKLESQKLRKEVLGDKHPLYATALNNVGSTYGELGNHREALNYKLEALAIWKQVLGDKHPLYATALNNVGGTYVALGYRTKALPYLLEALAIWKQVLGDKHPLYATALNNVGGTYKALPYLLEALAIQKEVLGEKHPHYAISLNNVGSTYGELGDRTKALPYLLEALAIQKEVLGEKHPHYASTLGNVRGTYTFLIDATQESDPVKAVDYAKDAERLGIKLGGEGAFE